VEPEYIHWGAQLSRDGGLLAYACNRRNGVDFDIFLRDLESGEERTLFAPGGLCEPLAFSPDGRAVAVEQLTEKPGDNDLWLVPGRAARRADARAGRRGAPAGARCRRGRRAAEARLHARRWRPRLRLQLARGARRRLGLRGRDGRDAAADADARRGRQPRRA